MITFLRDRYLACATSRRCLIAYAFGGGLVLGGITSWYVANQPPWLEFNHIAATYVSGSQIVEVTGSYTATPGGFFGRSATGVCEPDPKNPDKNPLDWRQEVKGSADTPLAQYAPRPEPPALLSGTHRFRQEIPLTEGIKPDGWRVSVLVTCDNPDLRLSPVRSGEVVVMFLDSESGAFPGDP